jgi:hypothetical protein
MDFSSLASYWQIKALLMLEPSVVTPQNQYFPANSERMSVHLEVTWVGQNSCVLSIGKNYVRTWVNLD